MPARRPTGTDGGDAYARGSPWALPATPPSTAASSHRMPGTALEQPVESPSTFRLTLPEAVGIVAVRRQVKPLPAHVGEADERATAEAHGRGADRGRAPATPAGATSRLDAGARARRGGRLRAGRGQLRRGLLALLRRARRCRGRPGSRANARR